MTRVGAICIIAALLVASCVETGPGGSPSAAVSTPISRVAPAQQVAEQEPAPVIPEPGVGAPPSPGVVVAPVSPAPATPPDTDEPPRAGRAEPGSVVPIGVAVAVSVDGGRSFSTPTAIGTPWRASTLAGAVNGPGLRERIERSADGRIVYAFGSGPAADQGASGPARRVLIAVFGISVDVLPRAR